MRFTHLNHPIILNDMKKLLLIGMGLLLGLSACHRNDIRTETVQIEQLHSPEAAQKIIQVLQHLPGIQRAQPDLVNHTLTITFNGRMLYLKNIEYAIVEAGFSLPHWPASQRTTTAK